MATQDIQDRGRGLGTTEKLEYNLLFIACLSVCLPVMAMQRVFRFMRGRTVNPYNESVFAEAKSAAYAAVGYTFSA